MTLRICWGPVSYTHLDVYKRQTYEYLGSHKLEQDGKEGVVFRTWAPNAAKISVVGEFNGWDEKKDPMERISEGGVWQCFIPDKVKEYDVYRYAVTTQDSEVLMKADRCV